MSFYVGCGIILVITIVKVSHEKMLLPTLIIILLGDLTELQIVALRWRALAQQVKDGKNPVHFKVLYEALKDLDKEWDRDLLSNEEVS